VPDESVDIALSVSTFEHIAEPWLAAGEIGRILKPGGLSITLTVFAVRYHPVPQDYWRYTHSALELLFEKYGGLETVESGYDLAGRRDNRNGKLPEDLDLAPGGWTENWGVFHVGRKPK
jgi:ubiquinone/menaquinone biosynthesis C-methylase UbiE